MTRNLLNTRGDTRRHTTFPSRIFRGKLAEKYDGIGQYVLVNIAGESTSGALRSRIAVGDFGGGRTFPRGTPVTLTSVHGFLEVFLGNISVKPPVPVHTFAVLYNPSWLYSGPASHLHWHFMGEFGPYGAQPKLGPIDYLESEVGGIWSGFTSHGTGTLTLTFEGSYYTLYDLGSSMTATVQKNGVVIATVTANPGHVPGAGSHAIRIGGLSSGGFTWIAAVDIAVEPDDIVEVWSEPNPNLPWSLSIAGGGGEFVQVDGFLIPEAS